MADILLYGIVGDPGCGIDAATLVPAIQGGSGDITLRVNSVGGLVFDGLAIYNALKAASTAGRKVTVLIDGAACSIASVIAMAGDEIIMAGNALMMIHNPQDVGMLERDATELRAVADRLDKVRDQIVGIYAARTGLDADTLGAMMQAETWMTAAEALAQNFITAIGDALALAACDVSALGFLRVPDHPLFANATRIPAPAALPSSQEPSMPEPIVPAPNSSPTPSATPITPAPMPSPAPAPVSITPTDVTNAANAAVAAERLRASTIRNEVSRARLDAAFGDTLVNEGITVEIARERIIDQIATNAPTITNIGPAIIPVEQFQARAAAMEVAILNRANPINQLTDEARAFAGRRLVVLARDFLDATGVSTRHMSDVEVAQAVFRHRAPRNAGQHVTADFPALMGNTVGRTLRRGYELSPQTFRPFCRQASVPDFRAVSRVALSDISRMKQVAEGAQYEYATIGDAAEQYLVGKWGQIISLTWETIINDDLNAFDRLPMAMGAEAAQVESDVVWAIVLGNPDMADGHALFSDEHGNLLPAAAISVASLQTARTAIRTQTAPNGRQLNLTPSFLIGGPLVEQAANQFTSANYVATKNADINPEYNRSLTPIIEQRIEDDSWHLSANPSAQAIDTIEYAYLAGYEGMQTEQRQGFEVDGIDIKARLVFGAKAIDWRGMTKTTG